MIYLGIDCGTQGTKAVLFDVEREKIVARGYSPHPIISNDSGRREQKPSWWVDALKVAVHAAIKESGISPAEVAAIAVSGQHHGLVLLDEHGTVLRDAKIWNDTETAPENAGIIAEVGGTDKIWDLISTALPVGYTASKVRWVLKHEPAIYAKVRHALLPHDYLNYWLTGEAVTDAGEASGTGYFDVAARAWSLKMVNVIDPSGVLESALPRVASPLKPIGTIRKAVAKEFGFSPGTIVACGSGDNVMDAVGTGNVAQGRAMLTLGTSGVINLHSDHQPRDADRSIQVFCGVEEGWLPTTNTMNATSSTALLQNLFDLKVEQLEKLISESRPGADGLRIFPYFNGERMPALPNARGAIKGMYLNNFTRGNLMRATVEAIAYALKWGLEKTARTFGRPTRFRLTGGGSKSAAWRQVLADVFETEVVRVKYDEGGAFGAVLLAMAVHQRQTGTPTTLKGVCDRYVTLDFDNAAQPSSSAALYRELYEEFIQLRAQEYRLDS